VKLVYILFSDRYLEKKILEVFGVLDHLQVTKGPNMGIFHPGTDLRCQSLAQDGTQR
jgi:hypothetical protein